MLYSNSGYLVLAIIIRRVSGESIGAFAQKNIFDPLEMKNTFIYEDGTRVVKNRAIGYSKEGKEYKREHHFDFVVGGDGQVYTTVAASQTATPSGTATARPKRTYACARRAPARSATCRRPNENHMHRNGARRTSRPTRGARIYQPFYETPYPQPSIIGPAINMGIIGAGVSCRFRWSAMRFANESRRLIAPCA